MWQSNSENWLEDYSLRHNRSRPPVAINSKWESISRNKFQGLWARSCEVFSITLFSKFSFRFPFQSVSANAASNSSKELSRVCHWPCDTQHLASLPQTPIVKARLLPQAHASFFWRTTLPDIEFSLHRERQCPIEQIWRQTELASVPVFQSIILLLRQLKLRCRISLSSAPSSRKKTYTSVALLNCSQYRKL
jgi:hypothetical protein